MKNIVAFTLFLLSINANSYSQNEYQYSQPVDLNDGWKTNNFQSENTDSTLIYKLFNKLQNVDHEIHSVLLIKDSELIIEEYFNENAINKQHDLRSVTKSITSILMGIAIDKGFVDSIEDPISKYITSTVPTKNLNKTKDQIKIKHLLTMSTGLECDDWNKNSKGKEDHVFRKKDWIQYFLNLPLINQPGEVSMYCTMSAILSAEIISQASGMTLEKFAELHLFTPLGITNVRWSHTIKKEVMPSAKRVYMTSRDMAKIGQLIINLGMWNNDRLVSKEWIENSIQPKTKITGVGYGFFWWSIPFTVNETKITCYAATGNGGQYIFIFPESNLIAVFTGGAYNSQEDKLPFAIMTDIMLPTFLDEK